MKKFHSGFVALIGRPNVGKSTLMNCLIGEKIAITSHKPQTTRNKITSILTKEDFQCVFLDTPGIHKPKSKLGEYMMRSAETTFNEVDLVLMLIEPTTEVKTMDEYVLERIKNVKSPVLPLPSFSEAAFPVFLQHSYSPAADTSMRFSLISSRNIA